jgi:hypothetical protein
VTTAREYLRVSKSKPEDNGNAKSNDEQHEANLVAAASLGIDEIGTPYDDVGSASRYARKKVPRGTFPVLLDDLHNGRFSADVLMLWESSRGSR